MTEIEHDGLDGARMSLYGFLSSMFTRPPSHETLKSLLTPKTASHMKQMFPGYGGAQLFEKLIFDFSNGTITTEDIQLDFESLMRVPGPSYVHPYESSYAGKKTSRMRTTWGSLNGPSAKAVEQRYQEAALCANAEAVDFPDHMGAELEFMAQMSRLILDAGKGNNAIRGKKIRAKQIDFARTHLFSWVYAFSDQIGQNALTPFYKWLSEILVLFMKMEEHFSNEEVIAIETT